MDTAYVNIDVNLAVQTGVTGTTPDPYPHPSYTLLILRIEQTPVDPERHCTKLFTSRECQVVVR